MTAAERREFAFSLTKSEFTAIMRASQRSIVSDHGRVRLSRIPGFLGLVAVGVLCGFLLAPALVAPHRLDVGDQVLVFGAVAAAEMAGILLERATNVLVLRRVRRWQYTLQSHPRRLALSAAGLRQDAGGMVREIGWPEIERVENRADMLLLLTRWGDCMGVPKRVVDGDPAALDRLIADWRAAA